MLSVYIITEQLVTIAATTGIILDPTYTLKGVQGLLGEMEKNPARFKGKRILHIHTGMYINNSIIVCTITVANAIGGVYGLYDGRINEILQHNPATSKITVFAE